MNTVGQPASEVSPCSDRNTSVILSRRASPERCRGAAAGAPFMGLLQLVEPLAREPGGVAVRIVGNDLLPALAGVVLLLLLDLAQADLEQRIGRLRAGRELVE